jgi:hypothetical protein
VGSSGHHSNLVVETLDVAGGISRTCIFRRNMASFETIIPKLTDHTDCGVGGRQYGTMIVDLWSATRSRPQTLMWEITPANRLAVTARHANLT